MRRDKNDVNWKKAKEKVYERDNNYCRLCRVLSVQEMIALKKNAGSFIYRLDPAHYIAVSQDPSIMYDENNICLLNHYSHSNLDSSKDPITGEFISKEDVHNWWVRILNGNKKQADYLKRKGLL